MLRIALAIAAVACAFALAAPQMTTALMAGSTSRAPAEPPPLPAAKAAAVSPAPAPVAAGELILEPDARGQFEVEVEVNGQPVTMLVDTGASYVVLSAETAARIGLRLFDSDYTVRTQTANGIAAAAPVRLGQVAVGPIYLGDVKAFVAAPHALSIDLLGMSFLRRLGSVEQRSGRLVLRQ